MNVKPVVPVLQRRIAELEAQLAASEARASTRNEVIVYVDNPAHIATIKVLQEKICQFTSTKA